MPTEGAFGAIIRMRENGPEILLLERKDRTGWNLPGGRVEEGETIRETVVREVKEEIGYDTIPLWQIGDGHSSIKNGEVCDTACVFFCKVVGGTLVTAEENTRHDWFTLEDLAEVKIVNHPTTERKEGRMMKMIRESLQSFVSVSLS